ncbi:MAG: c-type cytochrome [Ramlibacter sp.]
MLPLAAQAQPSDAPSRGQLLYEAHCVQCHTTQMHWREARVARDWAGLRAQVQRWQSQIGEQWPPEDVDAVAQHLNATIYHYPVGSERALAPSGGVVASRRSTAP